MHFLRFHLCFQLALDLSERDYKLAALRLGLYSGASALLYHGGKLIVKGLQLQTLVLTHHLLPLLASQCLLLRIFLSRCFLFSPVVFLVAIGIVVLVVIVVFLFFLIIVVIAAPIPLVAAQYVSHLFTLGLPILYKAADLICLLMGLEAEQSRPKLVESVQDHEL